jgi:hypothetical protein
VAGADEDGDFLTNGTETAFGTSPFRADTDGDGAIDSTEAGQGYSPVSAASAPPPVIAVQPGAGSMSVVMGGGGWLLTSTTGQPSPVARQDGLDAPPAAGGFVNLPGFQPQTGLGRDLDADGVRGQQEWAADASDLEVDSDGDRFVDGLDGLVAVGAIPNGWDLDGDGFIDGEGDYGTAPGDGDDKPGKEGDVAPLGRPDGRVRAADVAVQRRIAADPAIVDALPSSQQRTIARDAAQVVGGVEVDARDVQWVLQRAKEESP